MGLFDLFKGSPKAEGKPRPRAIRPRSGPTASRGESRTTTARRRSRPSRRWRTAEAVEVLLKRFTFHMDPSITDQEEKDAAFRGILRAGRNAIEPVRAFAAKAESLAWPMKIIKSCSTRASTSRSSCAGSRSGTPTTPKFVDPEGADPRGARGASPPAYPRRGGTLSRGRQRAGALSCGLDPPCARRHGAVPALEKLLLEEESVRVRTRVAEGLASRAWPFPEDDRELVFATSCPPAIRSTAQAVSRSVRARTSV